MLSISPVRGIVAPGESGMCRITFMARGVPSFYDLDLICEVGNRSLTRVNMHLLLVTVQVLFDCSSSGRGAKYTRVVQL